MTITPKGYSIAGSSSWYDALFNFIKWPEGDIHFVYSDSKNIPTLGVGYALIEFTGTGSFFAHRRPPRVRLKRSLIESWLLDLVNNHLKAAVI